MPVNLKIDMNFSSFEKKMIKSNNGKVLFLSFDRIESQINLKAEIR